MFSGPVARAWFLLLLSSRLFLSAAEAPRQTQALFNGTNLAGFTAWLVDTKDADPRRVFTVSNGLLRVSGDGLGYLATTNEFRDYRLTVEFRWGATNTAWGDRFGRARDSGIFLHATGPDGNSHDGHGAFMSAIECNLFEGATGDILLIRGTNAAGGLIAPHVRFNGSANKDADGFRWFDPRGPSFTLERWGRVNRRHKSSDWRDVFGFRDVEDVEQPAGEWNRVEIECQGTRLQVEVNGKRVNEVSDVSPASGKILLQCEGSEIYFRRVELHPLPAR